MFKRLSLILFLLFSFLNAGKTTLFVLYPDADLSNTNAITPTDIETSYYLFVDGLKQYSDIEIIENPDFYMCDSKECAILVNKNYNADQIINSRIRVLGSSIIFIGMIFDNNGENEFTSRITAKNAEDMENAANRLAKSLIEREDTEEVADIDNIVDSDSEQREERKSLHKIGGYIGYLIPFDGYSYRDQDGNLTDPGSILQLGISNYWEYKNNSALFFDMSMNATRPIGFGLDLSYNRFINKKDISPFYGGGIGWQLLFEDETQEEMDRTRHGLSLSAHMGAMFFRTYDVNIALRLKYHILFSTLDSGFDNGISLNVSLIRKMTPNKTLIGGSGYRTVEYRYPLLEILFDILLGD